jgi:hypothetical protein
MAKHKGRQFWSAHITAAGSSGLSKAAYCRRHGLDYKTFHRWSARLNGAGRPGAGHALVPVVVREAEPAPGTLTLRVGADVALSMPPSVDARWLATLLRTITTC